MLFDKGTHNQLHPAIEAIGASVAIFTQDDDKNFSVVSANELFTDIAEISVGSMIGAKLREMFPRYVEQPIQKELSVCIQTQSSREIELVIDRRGQQRWWRLVVSPVLGSNSAVNRVLTTWIEISDKKELERSLIISRSRFEAVVEAAYDGIITIDEDQVITLINRSACAIFGGEKEQFMGKSLETLIPHNFRKNHKNYVKSFGESPISSRPMESRVAVRGLRSDGTEFPVEITIAKISVDGNTEYTAVVRDISERARLIEQLQKEATQDSLTGISNRRSLEQNIVRELERCKRFKHSMCLVMADLNHFKRFNDTYGHQFGDEVLKAFTEFLHKRLRTVDLFGRWGGDEFVVALPETNLAEGTVWVETVRSQMSQLNEELSQPDSLISASFGAVETQGEESLEKLISKVDLAMYADKTQSV